VRGAVPAAAGALDHEDVARGHLGLVEGAKVGALASGAQHIVASRFAGLAARHAVRPHQPTARKNRGGNGAIRKMRFLEPMTAAILSGHRLVRPHGMAGGEAGAAGRNCVLRVSGARTDLGPFDQTEMAAGDVFVVESPGGGGYGGPDSI